MKVLSPLTTLLTLTVANVLAWGVPNTQLKLSDVKPLSLRFECNADYSGTKPVTASTMAKGLRAAMSPQPQADSTVCPNCASAGSDSENWCRHTATICYDPYPWHENYERERRIDLFDCNHDGKEDTAYHNPWIDSGCCGSADPDNIPVNSYDSLPECSSTDAE